MVLDIMDMDLHALMKSGQTFTTQHIQFFLAQILSALENVHAVCRATFSMMVIPALPRAPRHVYRVSTAVCMSRLILLFLPVTGSVTCGAWRTSFLEQRPTLAPCPSPGGGGTITGQFPKKYVGVILYRTAQLRPHCQSSCAPPLF